MRDGVRLDLVMAFVGVGAALAPAQEVVAAARRATIVRVVDAQGTAIAGANVTFAGSIPHLGAEYGPVDVQNVTSDVRGYARADLQPFLCHVAWAVGPADAAGRSLRSLPTQPFAAGALLELRCEESCGERRLVVTGVEAWKDRGPLRFVAMTPSPGTETTLELRDGAFVVPPMLDEVVVEIRTADGQPLWSTKGDDAIVLPPPQRIRVEVRDERGQPLQNALVQQRVHRRASWRTDGFGSVAEARLRTLGRTDANGAVDVVVCYPADPFVEQRHGELLMFASAAGHAPVAGGIFNGAFYVDDRRITGAPTRPLRLTCRAVEPMVGNCGRVPAGTVLHLQTVSKLFSGANSYSHDARTFLVPVAANGNFVLDGVPSDLHCCRMTLVPPGEPLSMPIFPTNSGRELPPEVVVRPGSRARGFAAMELRVAVKDVRGGPARGAVACLLPRSTDGVLLRDSVVRLPLDPRGAAVARVVAGEWALLLLSRDGWAVAPVDVREDAVSVDLTMQELATMDVRLLDESGEPVAGARVVARGTAVRATDDALHNLVQSGVASAARWNWRALRTDGAGLVRIPFVPVDGLECRVALQWPGGTTADFALGATTTPLVVRSR